MRGAGAAAPAHRVLHGPRPRPLAHICQPKAHESVKACARAYVFFTIYTLEKYFDQKYDTLRKTGESTLHYLSSTSREARYAIILGLRE